MKRLVSLLVSAAILLALYSRIDLSGLGTAFRNLDLFWMAIAVAMVVPLTLLSAYRLQQLVPAGYRLPFGEANRLILAASGLNMILPSKMGDLAKAYFIQKQGHLNGSLALSLVVFEKATDMLALLLWCLLGLVASQTSAALFWPMTTVVVLGVGLLLMMLGSRRFTRLAFGMAERVAPAKIGKSLAKLEESWLVMLDYMWQGSSRYVRVLSMSVVLWFLHFLQIWFFILALRAWTPLLANLALGGLAILVGLLPFTFAGIGTRDAAIVFFYRPYLTPSIAAALGMLFTLRYVLPALGGLPFLSQYMTRREPSSSVNAL